MDPKEALAKIEKAAAQTMSGHLGIEFIESIPGKIVAKMPVDHRTCQPMGLLHGGASVALAETLGSIGSYLLIDQTKQAAVGLEINANHIRSARSGFVTGRASILHQGKKTHVWDIRITNEASELVCVSRLTVAIIDLK